ncbi:MAG: hypothetical protein PHF24_08740 [Syntrophomonas sp.]|nr:hypothetical protein [Syntrophomonas sp.]
MNNLVDLLKTHGPQTGKEIIDKTTINIFKLWQTCNQSSNIITKTIGTRYLRLDKHVEGIARLSPSILREFCNYSVISLQEQTETSRLKAEQIHQSIIKISKNKYEIAQHIMEQVIDSQPAPEIIRDKVCFIIAGDVAYEMAHLEARPEFSTGRIVNGSDLDIVIIHKNLSADMVKSLDASVYDKKYNILCNPAYREEIDYIIKDITKVEKQLNFEGFEAMVASKILDEGKYLCGNLALFSDIKKMVMDFGIPEKLAVLKEKASIERENAKRRLLALNDTVINDKEMAQLFYTTSEREEFY